MRDIGPISTITVAIGTAHRDGAPVDIFQAPFFFGLLSYRIEYPDEIPVSWCWDKRDLGVGPWDDLHVSNSLADVGTLR